RKDRAHIAGVSPVTLCSRSGSASSAPKAANAKSTSTSASRGSHRSVVLPAETVPGDHLMPLSLGAAMLSAHPSRALLLRHQPKTAKGLWRQTICDPLRPDAG